MAVDTPASLQTPAAAFRGTLPASLEWQQIEKQQEANLKDDRKAPVTHWIGARVRDVHRSLQVSCMLHEAVKRQGPVVDAVDTEMWIHSADLSLKIMLQVTFMLYQRTRSKQEVTRGPNNALICAAVFNHQRDDLHSKKQTT